MFDLDKHFAVHGAALKVSAKRSELLARNLANADTPNYRAVDIDFQKAMARALGDADAGALKATQRGHLSGGVQGDAATGGLVLDYVDRQPLAPALDGNTVDVSLEQAEFAKNTVRYQASLNFINSQLRGLMTAITGQ